MTDFPTVQPCLRTGEPPEWVLDNAPGPSRSSRDLNDIAKLRGALWRDGAYELPQELINEAHGIAAEAKALQPFVERLADRWVAFERATTAHYAGVPEFADLDVPCSHHPDRRVAWDAIVLLGDAIGYETLATRSYGAPEDLA